MPPKTQQKSKEAKMAAAMAGGKSKKKKWSKGKVREKVANKVLFDDETYTRFMAEIPKVCTAARIMRARDSSQALTTHRLLSLR